VWGGRESRKGLSDWGGEGSGKGRLGGVGNSRGGQFLGMWPWDWEGKRKKKKEGIGGDALSGTETIHGQGRIKKSA